MSGNSLLHFSKREMAVFLTLLFSIGCTTPAQEPEEATHTPQAESATIDLGIEEPEVGNIEDIPYYDEAIIIDVPNAVERKMVETDVTQGDTEKLLSNEVTFTYPDDRYLRMRKMSPNGILYGAVAEDVQETHDAVIALDTNTGEYYEVAYSDERQGSHNLIVDYAGEDFIFYCDSVNTRLALYYVNLQTFEKKLLYSDNVNGMNGTIFVDTYEEGFIFSMYDQRKSTYVLYRVPFSTLEPEEISQGVCQPIIIEDDLYVITEDPETHVIYFGKMVDDHVIPILIESDEILTRVKRVDNDHLMMVMSSKNDAGYLLSSAYLVNVNSWTGEYLFTQEESLIESLETNDQYMVWLGGRSNNALAGNLFDYRNKIYYPLVTNFTYLGENGFVYRKWLIDPETAVPGTHNYNETTCLAYVSFE